MKRELQKRAVPATFEVRTAADGSVGFRGYASVFDQIAHGEVIRHGAYDKTLDEQDDVRMLVNHDGVPIARTASGTLQLSVDEKGLLAEADSLDPGNPTVAELVSALARGDIDQMSFAGWFTRESQINVGTDDEPDLVREVREVKLADVSIVTYPWYDETTAEINEFDQALLDLRAGRVLTPERRSMLMDRMTDPEPEPAKGRSLALALASRPI